MTESSPTSAPQGSAAAKKKGLSPLAWIGIGCLALLLLSGILFFSCSYFVAKKAKSFAGDLEKNPVKTMAELAVRVNPNLEIVSTDDEAGTMTIYDKSAEEELTLSYKDIADGKFSMRTEKGQVNFDAGAAAEGGLVTIEGSEGSQARIGQTGVDLPDWIPVYPGSQPSVGLVSTSGPRTDGAFSFSTTAGAQEVLSFYRERLEAAGFSVETATFPTGGSLTAKGDGREMSIFLAGWGETLRGQGTYNFVE